MKVSVASQGTSTALWRVMVSFLIFLINTSAQANTDLNDQFSTEVIDQSFQHRELIDSVQVLVDAENQLTFEQVIQAKNEKRFRPLSETGNSFGINKKSYWFRVSLRFDLLNNGEYFLEITSPLLNEITAFLPDGRGGWITNIAGDTYPYAARMVDHQHVAYSLKAESGDKVVQVFFRIGGGGAKSVPIYLWSANAFSKHENGEHLFTGITVGALMALVLFNAFLFLSLRDSSYLWYVGYLGFISLFLLNYSGMGYRYLWPQQTLWANLTGLIFLFLSLGFGLLFARKILNLRQYSLSLSNAFYVLAGWCFVLTALVQVIDTTLLSKIAIVTALFVISLTLYGIFFSIRQGYTPAIFVLFAFVSMLPGVIMTILRNVGVIDSSFLSEHMIAIGFIADAVLLSLALAYRIRYINNELHDVRDQAIRQKEGFSHQLVNAQDNERKNIASELHDGLGQNLIVIKNKLKRYFNNQENESRTLGVKLDMMVQDTIDLVRGLSSRLYPHQLERVGLKLALENVIESSFSDSAVNVEYKIDEPGEVTDPQAQLHLYRICQEGIKNILTHARAYNVSIRLKSRENKIIFEMIDDGRGVDSSWLAEQDFSGSFGLNSIKERVQLLSGNTVYSTSEEGGFKIKVEIPLHGDEGTNNNSHS